MHFYDDFEDDFFEEKPKRKSNKLKKFKKDEELIETKRKKAKRDANRKKERELKDLDS